VIKIVKRKPKKIDVKDIFIGKGKNTVSFRNIKRVTVKGRELRYYKGDIYVKNKLKHPKTPIQVKNKKELYNYLKKAYPKKLIKIL